MTDSGWARKLFLSSAITQGAIYVIRPMITYRALELDASPVTIGYIAAVYALFPVLLAPTMHARCERPESAAAIASRTIESAKRRSVAETPMKKVPMMTKRPSPTWPTYFPKVSAKRTGKSA